MHSGRFPMTSEGMAQVGEDGLGALFRAVKGKGTQLAWDQELTQ